MGAITTIAITSAVWSELTWPKPGIASHTTSTTTIIIVKVIVKCTITNNLTTITTIAISKIMKAINVVGK